jgi:hypothetical protein
MSASHRLDSSPHRLDNSSTGPLESPGLSGDTLVEAEPVVEEGDHERFAHYVKKDKIVASAVLGEPVIALCGKVWVPNRDPARFPVCPACEAIYKGLPHGGDDGDAED